VSAIATVQDVIAVNSPYVGLNFYTQDDAAMFFGRDSERTVLISNLRASRLTLLYAKSGAGKSSILRAGVAARLAELAERSFSRRGTARNIPVVFSSWRDDPTAELIAQLYDAISPFLRVASPPVPAPDQLDLAIEVASRATDAALLVILDQFEEYLLYRTREVRDRPFADELAACINRADLRVNFLVSIREDAYFALGDLFKGRISNVYGNYFHLEHLTREAAREAIEKPIASFNQLHISEAPMEIEPGLVNAVLDQFRPDQLAPDQGGVGRLAEGNGSQPYRDEIEASYLQLVMERLWETELENGSRKLRLTTLDELGGAQTIVRTHVDRALGGLPDEEREAAVAIFHHLVTPSRTKIALAASDLADYIGYPADETNALLQRLADNQTRILRPVPPPPGRMDGSRFEISHDLLAPAILDWDRRHKALRLEREKEAAEQRAQAEKARARRLRTSAIIVTIIAILLVMAMVVTTFALSAEKTAIRQSHLALSAERAAVLQSHLAQSEEMAAESINVLPANGPLAMLLGLQAYKTAPTLQAESVLIQAIQQPLDDRLVATSPVNGVAFSPDSHTVAVGDVSGHVGLWDVATGRKTATLAEGSQVDSVAFTPDGRTLAAGDNGGDIGLWDVATGRKTATLAEYSVISSVAFSPDGRTLAAGDDSGQVGLWDVATGHKTATLAEGSQVDTVAFSPDGRILAAGDVGGDVGLWNVATERKTATLAEGSWVTSVAFSPDGRILAVGDESGHVGLWGVTTARKTTLAEGSWVTSVAFSPDGRTLAVGDYGGHLGLWDVATRQKAGISAQGAIVESVAFDPDDMTLVTGDSLGNVDIWNAANGQRFANLNEGRAVTSLALSSDGRVLAIGGLTGDVVLLRQNLANLTRGYFMQLVCGKLRGNMTTAQWAEYAPGQPYQKTCP
jgi:hypothetical protein